MGDVYARHLASIADLHASPHVVESLFRAAFASAPPPDYARHPSGHAAERAWWKSLVARVFESPSCFAPDTDSPRQPTSLPPETLDALFDALFSHYAQPGAWKLFPEVPEFLEAAARHHALAVVSNFDDRLAPILDGLGIANAFARILTSADARCRKPDPAIFTRALALLGAAPADTIHCGDSLHLDYHAARAAGLRAFHLQRPRQDLLDFLAFCRP